MRKWGLGFIVLLLMVPAGSSAPAFASNRVTVEQVEKILSSARSKPDADVAKELAGLELTERLGSARLRQLRSNFPGEKSQQALVALADTSAFLDPPPSEIPATARPDPAVQRRMMALTVDYLGKTLPLLPNLFAARDTMRFETPASQFQGDASGDNPLRPASKSTATVLYRDGREFVDSGTGKEKKARTPDKGLTTWGEFGPILGIVFIDAARSQLSWSHWELGPSGPQAVFHYSVPKDKSHYDVRFCCVAESYGFDISVVTERVGYHGEIAVDPNSGTIFRITALADISPGNPIGQADIAVEYGPEQLGGRTYFCPVRGIAIAQTPDLKLLHSALNPPPATASSGALPGLQKASLSSISQGPRQTLLNDVAFREFHLFRAESKLILGNNPDTARHEPEAPVSPESSPLPADVVQPAEETAVESSALAAQPPAGTPVGGAAPLPVAGGGPPPEPVIPEISLSDANGVPDAPRLAHGETDSAVTLRLSARLVDVPLVALDKKGRPITNLKPEDLEILDVGRKVDLRSFTPANSTAPDLVQPAPTSAASEKGADHAFSNRTVGQSKVMSHDQQGNTIVLLIDNHLSFDDLSNVREQMRTFLLGMHEGERVALYVMRSGGFQILQDTTTDHALVATTLAKWTPSAQNLSLGQEQEARNRQSMDYVHNTEDLLNVNGHSQIDATSNTEAPDPKLRTLGDDPGRDALGGLVIIARHLGAIAGHKNLVWIASDNTLADWTNGSLNIDTGAKVIQASVLRAQEAMNDAHVSVYPLDASRLEAGGIDASIGTRNVSLNPTAKANQVPGGCGNASNPGTAHGLPAELTNGGDISTCQSDLHPGRAIAQMQQDLHPIQGAYRELADATGGVCSAEQATLSPSSTKLLQMAAPPIC